MKETDLMIGDWVRVKRTQKIVKVKEVKQNCIYTEDNGYEYSEIEPIPLTKEILEKIGFVIKKKWAQIGNFGDSPLIMWHFEDDAVLGDFKHELEVHQNDTGKVHVHIPCEYVHELQHALKLCGIEKEIEL